MCAFTQRIRPYDVCLKFSRATGTDSDDVMGVFYMCVMDVCVEREREREREREKKILYQKKIVLF
jgi:hypothetical protein